MATSTSQQATPTVSMSSMPDGMILSSSVLSLSDQEASSSATLVTSMHDMKSHSTSRFTSSSEEMSQSDMHMKQSSKDVLQSSSEYTSQSLSSSESIEKTSISLSENVQMTHSSSLSENVQMTHSPTMLTSSSSQMQLSVSDAPSVHLSSSIPLMASSVVSASPSLMPQYASEMPQYTSDLGIQQSTTLSKSVMPLYTSDLMVQPSSAFTAGSSETTSSTVVPVITSQRIPTASPTLTSSVTLSPLKSQYTIEKTIPVQTLYSTPATMFVTDSSSVHKYTDQLIVSTPALSLMSSDSSSDVTSQSIMAGTSMTSAMQSPSDQMTPTQLPSEKVTVGSSSIQPSATIISISTSTPSITTFANFGTSAISAAISQMSSLTELKSDLISSSRDISSDSSVIYSSQPEVMLTSGKPDVMLTTNQPDIMLTSSRSEVMFTSSQPEVVMTSSHQEVMLTSSQDVTLTSSQPEVMLTSSQPDVVMTSSQLEVMLTSSQPDAIVSSTMSVDQMSSSRTVPDVSSISSIPLMSSSEGTTTILESSSASILPVSEPLLHGTYTSSLPASVLISVVSNASLPARLTSDLIASNRDITNSFSILGVADITTTPTVTSSTSAAMTSQMSGILMSYDASSDIPNTFDMHYETPLLSYSLSDFIYLHDSYSTSASLFSSDTITASRISSVNLSSNISFYSDTNDILTTDVYSNLTSSSGFTLTSVVPSTDINIASSALPSLLPTSSLLELSTGIYSTFSDGVGESPLDILSVSISPTHIDHSSSMKQTGQSLSSTYITRSRPASSTFQSLSQTDQSHNDSMYSVPFDFYNDLEITKDSSSSALIKTFSQSISNEASESQRETNSTQSMTSLYMSSSVDPKTDLLSSPNIAPSHYVSSESTPSLSLTSLRLSSSEYILTTRHSVDSTELLETVQSTHSLFSRSDVKTISNLSVFVAATVDPSYEDKSYFDPLSISVWDDASESYTDSLSIESQMSHALLESVSGASEQLSSSDLAFTHPVSQTLRTDMVSISSAPLEPGKTFSLASEFEITPSASYSVADSNTVLDNAIDLSLTSAGYRDTLSTLPLQSLAYSVPSDVTDAYSPGTLKSVVASVSRTSQVPIVSSAMALHVDKTESLQVTHKQDSLTSVASSYDDFKSSMTSQKVETQTFFSPFPDASLVFDTATGRQHVSDTHSAMIEDSAMRPAVSSAIDSSNISETRKIVEFSSLPTSQITSSLYVTAGDTQVTLTDNVTLPSIHNNSSNVLVPTSNSLMESIVIEGNVISDTVRASVIPTSTHRTFTVSSLTINPYPANDTSTLEPLYSDKFSVPSMPYSSGISKSSAIVETTEKYTSFLDTTHYDLDIPSMSSSFYDRLSVPSAIINSPTISETFISDIMHDEKIVSSMPSIRYDTMYLDASMPVSSAVTDTYLFSDTSIPSDDVYRTVTPISSVSFTKVQEMPSHTMFSIPNVVSSSTGIDVLFLNIGIGIIFLKFPFITTIK